MTHICYCYYNDNNLTMMAVVTPNPHLCSWMQADIVLPDISSRDYESHNL